MLYLIAAQPDRKKRCVIIQLMAQKTSKSTRKTSQKPIEQYEHKDKQRLNNPPVGLVDAHTDNGGAKKQYAYDPHLDSQLQWAGKAVTVKIIDARGIESLKIIR